MICAYKGEECVIYLHLKVSILSLIYHFNTTFTKVCLFQIEVHEYVTALENLLLWTESWIYGNQFRT